MVWAGGTYSSTGDVYEGEWKYGWENGTGTMKYANGNVYVGTWDNHKRHGKGMMKYADGSIFVGYWKDQPESFPSRKDHTQILFDEILSCIHVDFMNAIKQHCILKVRTHNVTKDDANLKGQKACHSSKIKVDDAAGLHRNRGNKPQQIILTANKEDGNIVIDFGVLMHELGHAFDYMLFKFTRRPKPKIYALSQRDDVKKICDEEKSEFTREYFHDAAEFVAEVFARFSLDPLRASKEFPQMTKVFKQELKKLPNMQNYNFENAIVNAEKIGKVLDKMVPHPFVDVFNIGDGKEDWNLEKSIMKQESLNKRRSLTGGVGKGHRRPYIICLVTEDKDVARLCGRYIAHRLFRHRVQTVSLYGYEEAFLDTIVRNKTTQIVKHTDDIHKDLKERLGHHGFVLFLPADQGANVPSIAIQRYLQRSKTHEDLCVPCIHGDMEQVKKFQNSLNQINADVSFITCKVKNMKPNQVAKLILKIAEADGYLISNFAKRAITKGVESENITYAKAVNFWLEVKTRQEGRVELEDELGKNAIVQISKIDVDDVIDKYKRKRQKTPQERLDDMVGLKEAKKKLSGILAKSNLGNEFKKFDVQSTSPPRLNILLLGNPGTGKTRFAEILRDMLVERKIVNDKYSGILSPNNITDVDTLFKDNKGGVIFIDEFHQMHHGEERQEAVRAMVPYLDSPDHIHTVFIGAGYPKELETMVDDKKLDPGLQRRFSPDFRIKLADFTKDELGEILDIQVKNAKWPPLKQEVKNQAIKTIFRNQRWGRPTNGGGVENFFKAAVMKQQQRVIHDRDNNDIPITKMALTTFKLVDVEPDPPLITLDQFWKETKAKFSGLDDLFEVLKTLQLSIEKRRRMEEEDPNYVVQDKDKKKLNFFLRGPPGVGKTTIAREIIGKFFCALDIVPTFDLAPDPKMGGKGAHLLGEYSGWSQAKTTKLFEEGFGKTIFLDEISGYTKDSNFAPEITKVIVSYIEDYREKFVFVAADYTENYYNMLKMDRGLDSRFPYKIDILPWDAEQSTKVFLSMMQDRYQINLKEFEDHILKQMKPLAKTLYKDEDTYEISGFASGRTCETLAENVDRMILMPKGKSKEEIISDVFKKEYLQLKAVVTVARGGTPPAPSSGNPKSATQVKVKVKPKNKNKMSKKDARKMVDNIIKMEDKITEMEEALEEQGLDEEKRNDLEAKLKLEKDRIEKCKKELEAALKKLKEQAAPTAQQKPAEGKRAHFSGVLIHGEFQDPNVPLTKLWVEDRYSEYVGLGEYKELYSVFSKSISTTFDSVAIDKGTKIVFYSQPNFKGNIVFEKIGPCIIWNGVWKNDSRYWPYFETCAPAPFTKEATSSSTDMRQWHHGSMKITQDISETEQQLNNELNDINNKEEKVNNDLNDINDDEEKN